MGTHICNRNTHTTISDFQKGWFPYVLRYYIRKDYTAHRKGSARHWWKCVFVEFHSGSATATRVCHRRHVWCTLRLSMRAMIIIICCWARTAGHVHRIRVQCFDEGAHYDITHNRRGRKEPPRKFTVVNIRNVHGDTKRTLPPSRGGYDYCFRITRRKHVTVYT